MILSDKSSASFPPISLKNVLNVFVMTSRSSLTVLSILSLVTLVVLDFLFVSFLIVLHLSLRLFVVLFNLLVK